MKEPGAGLAIQDGSNYLIEEFRVLTSACRDYFDFFLKGIVLYLAILAAILKLLLDQQPYSSGRIAFFVLGNCVNLVAILTCFVTSKHYSRLAKRCKDVCGVMRIPDLYYPGTMAAAKMLLGIILLISAGWILLGFFPGD